jgi:hypothetical protein
MIKTAVGERWAQWPGRGSNLRSQESDRRFCQVNDLATHVSGHIHYLGGNIMHVIEDVIGVKVKLSLKQVVKAHRFAGRRGFHIF